MKKKLFLFCMMLTSSIVSMAGVALHVQTTTGGEVVYDFSEKPVVTFDASDMTVTTTSATVKFPITELKAFTFTDTANDIESVTATESDGDATVSIYNLSGMLVKTVKADNGLSRFTLDELPAGTYVVKSSHRTYKFIKK